jgi:heme/copper-type cytochrome/quinol oxidase subunit 3
MKISLALGRREALSRQTAWGCFTTNLALPGFGSLVAGRAVGYVQALLCVVGMALTGIFGLRFIYWNLVNWSHLHGAQTDPIAVLSEMWMVVRWAVLGMGLFLISLIWSLYTSLQILQEAKQNEQTSLPPKLS